MIESDALWLNPQHWGRLGVYTCPADSRLLVPARQGIGWTVNMGHRHAQLVLWTALVAVIGFVAGRVVFFAHAT